MKLSLSGRTDLALRLLRHLQEAGTLVPVAEAAAEIGTTPQYLPHVAAPLVKAGWVRSTRGPGGGYAAAGLEDVSLRDLIEAVEGAVEDGRCVLADTPCPRADQCALHVPWQRARRALLAELERTPLLVGPEEANRP